MALNLDSIQTAIFNYLDDQLAQPLVETGIPDATTVLRDTNGRVRNYVVIQFGDEVQRGTRNFAGTRNDDYEMPIYLQAISADPRISRQIANRIKDVFLGFSAPFTGEVRKRPGGAMFPVHSSTGAAEAFMFPASFAVTLQLQ